MEPMCEKKWSVTNETWFEETTSLVALENAFFVPLGFSRPLKVFLALISYIKLIN